MLLILSASCLLITTISGLMTYGSVRGWLMKSRLGDIDSSILSDLNWMIFISILSICTIYFSLKKNNITLSMLLCLILIYLSSYIFYRGYSLYYDPFSFVGLYGSYWMDNPKHPIFKNISREFKCCGFHRVGEFQGQKCKYKTPRPCAVAISEALSEAIKESGSAIFTHGILILVSAISLLVYFVIMTNALN